MHISLYVYIYTHIVVYCTYRCVHIYIYIGIYIYVHLQPLQGNQKSKEADIEGLVLPLFSRFVFVKSKGTRNRYTPV